MSELTILPAPPEKPKRRLNVNLPEEVEDLMRERYDAWLNERKAAEDIFGGKEAQP